MFEPIRLRLSISRAGARVEMDVWLYAALFVLGVGMIAAVMTMLRLRRRRLRASGGDLTCGHCGYRVRGLPGRTCPECGSDLGRVGARPAGSTVASDVTASILPWTVALPLPALLAGLFVAEYVLPRLPDPSGRLPYVHPVWFLPSLVLATVLIWYAGVRVIRGRTGTRGEPGRGDAD